MDAFEQVISEILWRHGYWPQTEFKVELTKEEKKQIGRPSNPRWEIDVVGFSGARNELWVVECKSYLDSKGVRVSAFDGSSARDAERFKLFNEPDTRKVVFDAMIRQLAKAGLCSMKARIQLILAAGKIQGGEKERAGLHSIFKTKGWKLWDPQFINAELRKLATAPYENQVSAVVAKLLLRMKIT